MGTGKCGSTLLFFRIKNSFSREHTGIFEPRQFEDIRKQYDPGSVLITKALILDAIPFLGEINNFFNKKILIVRDPRDVYISALLYTGGYHFIWEKSPEEILNFIDLLITKEQQPSSISLLEMFRCIWAPFELDVFSEKISNQLDIAISLAKQRGFFVVKYEDLINNDLNELENYLGFEITKYNEVDEEFSRVVRSKGSGFWKDWYLNEDIVFFRPLLSETIEVFGYHSEWATNSHPAILKEHCSEYVKRIVNERRKQAGLVLI